MAPAFLKSEYDDRLARVRTEMAARGLNALVTGDPDNINWLTGSDAWSFYTPQMMLVELHDGPFWMGQLMDAGAANFTTYLTAPQIVPYPEELVQRPDTHPMWTDAPLADGQTIAFELGGCMKRYNMGLARTVHLGTPSDELRRTAAAVEEGMVAVMDSLKPGAIAGDVHAAWQRVLDRYGLAKLSRIGYSIGVGYAPDWGEHTLSFRPCEATPVPDNAIVHVVLGMWMDDWGMELSETIHVRGDGCERMCDFPQHVHVVET